MGIHHATNIGKQFRPDTPLLPNYKWVPIGYHGRASSIRPSGVPVIRPKGQRKPPTADAPDYGPSRRLDHELELGVWIGPGNTLGEPIAIGDSPEHIAGLSLFNDWSARDLQAWEYQPLGPFLAKNFHSTVSPWLVTSEALAPFLVREDKACIILCRTSNAGAGELQDLLCDGEPLWMHVARKVSGEWDRDGNCMLVVGATYPEEMRRVREAAPRTTLLVPGVGAQGGDVQAVIEAGLDAEGRGLIVSSSRAVIFTDDPAKAARELRDQIEQAREATLAAR